MENWNAGIMGLRERVHSNFDSLNHFTIIPIFQHSTRKGFSSNSGEL
jgi:hypothetical protein